MSHTQLCELPCHLVSCLTLQPIDDRAGYAILLQGFCNNGDGVLGLQERHHAEMDVGAVETRHQVQGIAQCQAVNNVCLHLQHQSFYKPSAEHDQTISREFIHSLQNQLSEMKCSIIFQHQSQKWMCIFAIRQMFDSCRRFASPFQYPDRISTFPSLTRAIVLLYCG